MSIYLSGTLSERRAPDVGKDKEETCTNGLPTPLSERVHEVTRSRAGHRTRALRVTPASFSWNAVEGHVSSQSGCLVGRCVLPFEAREVHSFTKVILLRKRGVVQSQSAGSMFGQNGSHLKKNNDKTGSNRTKR